MKGHFASQNFQPKPKEVEEQSREGEAAGWWWSAVLTVCEQPN